MELPWKQICVRGSSCSTHPLASLVPILHWQRWPLHHSIVANDHWLWLYINLEWNCEGSHESFAELSCIKSMKALEGSVDGHFIQRSVVTGKPMPCSENHFCMMWKSFICRMKWHVTQMTHAIANPNESEACVDAQIFRPVFSQASRPTSFELREARFL